MKLKTMIKQKTMRPLLALSIAISITPVQGMQAMNDESLSKITGQALFVSDKIDPSGAPLSPTDFTFYRMGMDIELALNANIDKLQLGCGGFNETLASNSCDIDWDFVRFMGRNGSTAGNPVTSDFKLVRPYIEIAIRNDSSFSQREVAGIKFGSELADGYVGIGRRYQAGQVNQEHGGTCGSGSPNERLACHSGINQLSGYMNIELSGEFPVTIPLAGSATACFGDVSSNSNCNTPFFTEVAGSRISELYIPGVELTLSNNLLFSLFGITSSFSSIRQNQRFVHGFSLENTSDYFMSFQRESISYPTYDKSGHAAPTNPGWWMNVPSVRVVDFVGDTIERSIGEALEGFSAPGPLVFNSELNQTPPTNCYGSSIFC